ncbi:MAG: tRNA (adenosine(37)-N6)-threonylcarbamoyltransferase complex ATPase subunit type 1 TsaE [Clostridiaceae bacterium]|nr:tRNA (adenosine(37)-N6)-threonylcarbamoyltransferase complex ATPase subunit type 1 TsaE [Eubacteriales bacterium]
MEALVFKNLSEADTERLGLALSERLFPGAFLALYGDLGAGKTAFTRAVAKGLGIRDVTSPTFTIVREHEGNGIKLYHFDAYRLADADELYRIGFEDYLAQNGIVAMEWCENVEDVLPEERLAIRILGSGNDLRTIEFKPHGARYDAILEGFPCSF